MAEKSLTKKTAIQKSNDRSFAIEDRDTDIERWPVILAQARETVSSITLFDFKKGDASIKETISIRKRTALEGLQLASGALVTSILDYTMPRYPEVIRIPNVPNAISICGHLLSEDSYKTLDLDTLALLIAILDHAGFNLHEEKGLSTDKLADVPPRIAAKIALSGYLKHLADFPESPRIAYLAPELSLIRDSLPLDPSFTGNLAEQQQRIKEYHDSLLLAAGKQSHEDKEIIDKSYINHLNSNTYEAEDSTALSIKLDESLKDILNRLASLEKEVRGQSNSPATHVNTQPTEMAEANASDTAIGGLQPGRKRRGSSELGEFKPIQFQISTELISELKATAKAMGGNQSALAEEAIRTYLDNLKQDSGPSI